MTRNNTDFYSSDPMSDMSVDDRVNKLFDDLGGCGLFQIFIYFAIAFGMSSPSWFIYEVGFLTQEPETYTCTFDDGTVGSCTKEDICDGDDVASYAFNPNAEKYLDNWQERLDLTCSKEWVIGMIGGSLFIGWCITLLWLPAISDNYGRRMVFWIGMMIQLVLYTGLFFCKNLILMIFIWIAFGALSTIRIQIAYVYMMELLPKHMQTPVTSGWNVQEAMVYVIATIYFWKISKLWYPFVAIGYVWNIISIILMYWVPESPRWLVSAGKLDEAREAFEVVAKWNSRKLIWDEKLYDTK